MTLNADGDYTYNEDTDEYEGFPTEPKDFAVYVTEADDLWGGDEKVTVMTLTPVEFFEANGYMWDSYMPVEEKIPDTFGQAMEATYDTELSVEDAKAALFAIGFVEHEGYSKFMAEAYAEEA